MSMKDTPYSQSGFAIIPLIIVVAALAIGSSVAGVGLYVANQKSQELKQLSTEVSALKESLVSSSTASPSATPSASPEPSPEETLTPKPLAAPKAAVKAAVTNQSVPVSASPSPAIASILPTPTTTPQLSKREQCEQYALAEKSKFVLRLEEMKRKYQEEYNRIYYDLILKKQYEKAKLFQSGWEQAIGEVNNTMEHSYDIALANCLSGKTPNAPAS